ncbi:MAG: tRNA 2-thiouridine(34) synthase MnmA [Malacoplasma sp.]
MKSLNNIKIAVGISGGVDSSVSLLLLKKTGYDVVAVFMQNWDDFINNNINDSKTCSVWDDYNDAKSVCDKLGVELYKVDFIKEYWDSVFEKSIDLYKKGFTPNPDIFCNNFIKFDLFQKYCLEKFNCDFVATGHYANIVVSNGKNYLTESIDQNKDQTYFLSGLNQNQLMKALFPIGNFKKAEVREIAKKYNLINWNKKDSTGICFIGEQNFNKFLENYLPHNEGQIIDIETKKIIGAHKGLWFYTIGQRKNIGLHGNDYKYFVCKKDLENNILYVVSQNNSDKFLYSFGCKVIDFNWISGPPSNSHVQIKFRHSIEKVKGYFIINNDGSVDLKYADGAKAVTIGQQAVLYQEQICLGGGLIFQVE